MFKEHYYIVYKIIFIEYFKPTFLNNPPSSYSLFMNIFCSIYILPHLLLIFSKATIDSNIQIYVTISKISYQVFILVKFDQPSHKSYLMTIHQTVFWIIINIQTRKFVSVFHNSKYNFNLSKRFFGQILILKKLLLDDILEPVEFEL